MGVKEVFKIMASIGLDTTKFEQALDKSKGLAGGLGSALGTAAKVGAAALTAVSGATVAFGKSAIDAGREFDNSMSQVAATMGKSVDEITELRDFAQEMGATTAFSATQAADALNYMALAGYDSATSIGMLPNVLNLAAAGNFDLARASDMVTDTQTAFGISLDRTSQMVDEMAKAASTGNTSVEQLGDAFLVVGGLAQELNGGMVTLADGTEKPVDGIQELEIALTAMANAGVKGSEAGTHMRNMLLKLSKPTDDGAIALEKMGVRVFDTEGKMRSLSDVFGDLSNAMETMTQKEKITTIANLFNTRDLASAEALLNAVNQDWDKIGASILDAQGAAQKMANTQLDNLEGDMTLFKSALEGVQIAVSDGLTPVLRNLVQAGSKGLSEITGKLREYLASDATQEKLGKITGAVEKLLNIILDNSDKILDTGVTVISGIMDALGFLVEHIDVVATAVGALGTAWVGLKAFGIVKGITGVISTVGSLGSVIGSIGPIIAGLANPVTLIVGAIGAAAVAIIANWDKIKEVWGKAVEFFSGVWEGIKDVFSAVGSWLGDRFAEARDKIKEAWSSVKGFFSGVWEGIKEVFGGVKSWFSEKFSEARSGIESAWENVGSFFDDVKTNIINTFSDLPSKFMEIGGNLMSGLRQGISDAADTVINAASWVGNQVIKVSNWIFGNNSPSKKFKQIGSYLMQGLAIGIEDNIGTVEDSLNGLEDLVDDFDNDMSTFGSTVSVVTPERVGGASGRNTGTRTEMLLQEILGALQGMGVTIDGRAFVGAVGQRMNQEFGNMSYYANREVWVS